MIFSLRVCVLMRPKRTRELFIDWPFSIFNDFRVYNFHFATKAHKLDLCSLANIVIVVLATAPSLVRDAVAEGRQTKLYTDSAAMTISMTHRNRMQWNCNTNKNRKCSFTSHRVLLFVSFAATHTNHVRDMATMVFPRNSSSKNEQPLARINTINDVRRNWLRLYVVRQWRVVGVYVRNSFMAQHAER